MLFYPSKNNDALNRKPFQPERLTGRAMLNPHYPIKRLAPGTQAIIDSTAFQTMLVRKTPWKALEDQLRLETQIGYRMNNPDWHAEALIHYDQMLGVDEAYDKNGNKIKRRGTHESARPAIQATLESAKYYTTQRHRIRGALAFAAQGIDADQYINECVLPLFDLMVPGDWLALGGFCIIGRQPTLIPRFYETLDRLLPLCKKRGVARVHILGVCVAAPIRYATEAARKARIAISTDSSSIEVNSVMYGKTFVDGRWHKTYTPAQKYKDYHPCDLAHANITRYHEWSQSL
jgi:hypothetical protein